MRWSSEKELLLNRIKIYRRVDERRACGAGNLNLNGSECALDDELEKEVQRFVQFFIANRKQPRRLHSFLPRRPERRSMAVIADGKRCEV